jgi:hypothetical protein
MRLDVPDGPDLTRLHDFLYPASQRMIPEMHCLREHQSAVSGDFAQFHRLSGVHGKRLLAENVLPGRQCLSGPVEMKAIRQRNVYGVYRTVTKQFAI